MAVIQVQAEVKVGLILSKKKTRAKSADAYPEALVVTAIGTKNVLAIDQKNRDQEYTYSAEEIQTLYSMNGYDPELWKGH